MPAETKEIQELNRLLGIMEAAGIGTWEYDVSQNSVSWCAKTHSLLGLDSQVKPCGEAFMSAILAEDLQRLREEIKNVSRSSGQLSIECRVRWPDRSIHWLLVKGQVFRDFRGEPTTAAGIVMDITERKWFDDERERMRRETERQRELLKRLIEHAPIGIAVIDAQTGNYLLANPKYESSPGVRVNSGFVGHHVGEFVPPELSKFMNQLLQKVRQTRQPVSVRHFEANLGPDRDHTWWDNDVVPLLDAAGNVESILAITKEVTQEVLDRKKMEELASQMQASRDKLEAIIHSMSEGLIVIEPDGHILSANPAALRLHGLTDLKEVPGNVRDFPRVFEVRGADGKVLPPKDRPLARAMRGEVVSDLEIRGRRTDTGHTWVASYSATPILDAKGGVSLLIVAAHDLTPINQAQERLRQLMAELERSNRDLEQFAYVASHDLQEPLRMVSGFLKLLGERVGPAMDAESQELMGFAADGADRMSQLLKGLLQYSRVGTHGRKMEAVAVAEVVDGAIANLRMARDKASAKLTVGEMPTVVADRTQLIQLFQNLISNALKFRRPDAAPEIEIGSKPQGREWLFWVSDNGIGMQPGQVQRAFEIFQRLHVRGKYPGIGVGLAVCRKIVERHGGRIWAQSAEGKGSTFFFTLPQ